MDIRTENIKTIGEVIKENFTEQLNPKDKVILIDVIADEWGDTLIDDGNGPCQSVQGFINHVINNNLIQKVK